MPSRASMHRWCRLDFRIRWSHARRSSSNKDFSIYSFRPTSSVCRTCTSMFCRNLRHPQTIHRTPFPFPQLGPPPYGTACLRSLSVLNSFPLGRETDDRPWTVLCLRVDFPLDNAGLGFSRMRSSWRHMQIWTKRDLVTGRTHCWITTKTSNSYFNCAVRSVQVGTLVLRSTIRNAKIS